MVPSYTVSLVQNSRTLFILPAFPSTSRFAHPFTLVFLGFFFGGGGFWFFGLVCLRSVLIILRTGCDPADQASAQRLNDGECGRFGGERFGGVTELPARVGALYVHIKSKRMR